MGELYKLTFPNGRSYIGIAGNGAKGRFLDHRSAALKSDTLIYRAWRKHGEPILQVLAVVEDALLNEIEIKAIAAYGTMTPDGYNSTLGGEGKRGWVASLETRKKLSVAGKGRKLSEECKAKLRAALSNPSLETRGKMRAAKIGTVLSVEHRANIIKGCKSRFYSYSTEERARRSETARIAMTGRKLSPETCAKISAAVKANRIRNIYKLSLEGRAKISAANTLRRGVPLTLESRIKMSVAARQRWAKGR